MNIKEYQQLALRTEARNPEHTQADRWNHGVLGFVTESQEVYEARSNIEVTEEFGDLMWYVTLLADVAQVDLSAIEPSYSAETLNHWLAKCADIGKRWKYYNIPPSESALKEAVTQLYLLSIVDLWKAIGPFGLTIHTAFDRNIAKLKARYPEKFTTEAAANRDLAAERAALEGGAR